MRIKCGLLLLSLMSYSSLFSMNPDLSRRYNSLDEKGQGCTAYEKDFCKYCFCWCLFPPIPDENSMLINNSVEVRVLPPWAGGGVQVIERASKK